MSLNYDKTTNCGTSCRWLSFEVDESIHGQWRSSAGSLSAMAYSYDAAGRLSTVNDTPAGSGCTVRVYGFDADSNRTSLTTRAPNGDGSCASSGGTAQSWTYDLADRVSTSGYVFDTFGRITTVPAADAGTYAVTAAYHVNDLVRSITKNGATTTYTLDPARRFRTFADGSQTRTNHYAGDSDSPAWIAENTAGTNWTRNIAGIDGDLAAIGDHAGTVTLQLSSLHGDLVATASPSPSVQALLSTSESTEFGTPRVSSTARYGWLGAKQRAIEPTTGITLMGVRLYLPGVGRFLQVDPVSGGSANDYDYASQDAVNAFDLDGKKCWSWVRSVCKASKKVGRGIKRGATAAGRGARHVYRHANVSVGGCLVYCFSLSFAHGRFYGSAGGFGMMARGPSIGWTSAQPEEMEGWSAQACGAFKIGGCGQIGRRTKRKGNWGRVSFVTGLGWQVGPMYTRRLL